MDLPFESQKAANLCGVAAVDMLTRYYGITLNNDQMKTLTDEAIKTQGLSGATLKSVLENAGYFVAVFPGTIDREPTGVYHHLDSRRPLIVMLGGESAKDNHYVLLTGYDPEHNMFALLDPVRGLIAVTLENFKKSWILANRFTLLALPVNPLNQDILK